MSMLLLSTTDVIFTLGEEPSEPKMYVVVSGTLEYTDSYGEVAQVPITYIESCIHHHIVGI